MTANSGKEGMGLRAVREGLFLGALSQPENLKLAGTRCSSCGETSLGSVALCPNCGSAQVEVLGLGDQGTLWTFTVARHRPPGDYRGPEPFKPLGIGLVELAEGQRVMSPLDCPLEQLRVGMPLSFTPYLRHDKDGGAVVAFVYRSAEESAS
jgi:uncharacterized OB-fold protein